MKLTCPSQNRLREYLEGSVNETDSEKILDHIEGCSSCDHVLATMESEQNDVMNEVCKFVRTESLLQEPEFEQLRNTAGFSQADTTAVSDVDEHPETGKRLRDYRLVKKIGEGGMGTVYQAFHVHLAKHVALKILPSDKLRSKQSVARFRQEMRAVGQVNHPNVVSASDAGTIEGQHFLVMELVQGADLARIIHDRGPLNVADACEIVRQAAIGLQHAHDNGLVHRDVKPSNIMLALDGSVKLLDLGLAGLNNTEFEATTNVVVTDRLTSVGQIMGTLDYMAPEQITASPQVDGKADIYALGATLFQLLTGRTPCGDRSEGTPERIEAVLHNPPLDIATLRNDVPEELCALLLKMLAKKPEDRPQAAIDVASELTRFASDADLDALAEACRTSLDMPSADVDVTDDVSFVVSRTAQPQDDVNSRRPLTAVALACFFLVLLVAAVVYYIQTDNGVIRVRVMDESLAVTITGQMVEMKDGNKQLIIRAGHHKLEVSHRDSDFKFLTDQFEVERNGETAFEVDLIPGQVVVSQEGKPFKTMLLPKDARPIETDSSPYKAVGTNDELAKKIENMPERKSGFLIWPDGTFRVLYSDSAMRYVSLSDTEVIIDDPPLDDRDNRHFKIEGLKGTDVVEIAMSPDGRFVAYSTKSKSVLFDAETAKPVMTLHEGEQPAHFLQFSPSGRYLLLGIGNKGRMFEVPRPGMSASGRSWLVGHNGPITHARFDREEWRILTGSKDQSVIIWRNNLEGKKIQTLKHQGTPTTVRFSPDEKSILTASTNPQDGKHSVEVWDAAQGKLQLRIEHGSAASAIFTKDGKQVVSVSKDTIAWWNAFDGTEVTSLHLAGIDYTDAHFADDRLHLVVFFENQAILWDLLEAKPIRKLTSFAHRLRTGRVPKDSEDDDSQYAAGVPVSGQFSTDMRPGYRQFYMLSDKGVWNMWSVARASGRKGKTSDSAPTSQPRSVEAAVATDANAENRHSDFDEIDRELYGTPSGREMMAEMYRRNPDEQKSVAEKLIAEGKDEAARRILSLVVPPDPKAMAALNLAKLHEKAGDFEKAANAYLEAYRITPALLDDEHLPAITKAGRVPDLVEVFTEDRLRTLPFNNRASRVVRTLLRDEATRAEGYKLHRRWWAAKDRDHYGWLNNPQHRDFWKEVPDPGYYLRSKLLPSDVASEARGWNRFRVEVWGVPLASPPVWGMPLGLKPLLHNKDELRQIAQEVKAAIEQHPDWQAGAALLCFLEAEVGNNERSVELLNQVLADAESQSIPPKSAWILGLSLEGRNAELDRLVMRLYEHSLRNWPAQGELRESPISSLATLYGKYDRGQEARQLLFRLAVDNYDINIELAAFASAICSVGRIPQNANRCTECHKKERNLFDVTLMSQKLTDIGYPVDALLSLYRIDSSFGNAYQSDDEWAKTTTPKDFFDSIGGGRSKFLPAKEKAEKAITPQDVLEALKSGVFSSRDMTKPVTSDADLVIDLMTSVRGVDGKPTLFSPAVEVLELAAKATKGEAAVANVQIDRLLSEAFDKSPDHMEAGIAAAVFAFLRKDLDAAERRAHNLHECVTRRAPQKSDIALWLVARHALRNERTREIGGKLTDRAVTAAEQNDDPGKKAIIHERNKLVGLKPNPSSRPQEKARQAESPTSSNAEELAAIAWVKSVDGRIIRAKSKRGSRPVDYVGLRRGAGSDFNAAPVTDEGLKHLAAFPELRKLDLGTSPKVTSNGIKGLKELPKLIDLSYSPRRKDCVQALTHLTNLKRLNLFQGNLTDSDLTFLSGLSLEKLCLSYTSVSDDGLKHIVPLSKLDALHLNKTLVSDAGMKQLVTMESLRTLDLSQTKITKSGLKELTRLKKLRVLSLAGLEIGDAEVELLSAFEGLEKLSLHNNPLTDEGMKTIGRLKELRRLSLVSTEVTDEGLPLLATCNKLEMADLYDTKVTREGTAALRKALPNCVMTRSFSYGGIPDVKITRTKTGVILKAAEDGWP